MGRIASETRTINGVTNGMSYGYNLDGSLKTLTYPSGATITYTPDSAGRAVSAIDNGNGINYATAATYDATSALTGFASGNGGSFAGITNTYSFNKRLQPVFMSAASPTQTVFSIGYDFHVGNGTAGSGSDNGNVYALTNNKDTTRHQTFTYDALNRLVSAQNAGTDCTKTTVNSKTQYWGNNYGYDAWGNLLSKTVTKCSAENLNNYADAQNRTHAVTGPDYQYDAAGNMIHDSTSGLNYFYDQENRITGAGGFTYTYGADGDRVEKSNGSTGTLYCYMSPGIVAETDLAGNLQSEYVFFDGDRVARKDFPSNAVSYYFSDHLKTTDIVTDAQGNIKNESDFNAWGGELSFSANDSNHYKFTGKERDSESQLDYFGARYYSNGLGRFITPDWSATPVPVPYADLHDPQSLNQYSYVRNLSTSTADPDGHYQTQLADLKPGECNSEACRKTDAEFYEQMQQQYERKIGEFLEKLNNVTSLAGWKTDEQVAADQAAQEAKWRAEWAKEHPLLQYPELQIGIVDPSGLGGLGAASSAEEAVSVYQKAKTPYVGITKDLAQRQFQHGEKLEAVVGGLTRTQAKGVEQAVIEQKGLAKNGGQLTNRINSIAKTNPIYKQAVEFGRQLLKSIGF